MRIEHSAAPPNSLVLLVTSDDPAIPQSMQGTLATATDTCIAVGTLNELDGETSVALTDEPPSEEAGLTRKLTATLDVENGFVAVSDVYAERYLELPWTRSTLEVSVWVNDVTEPDVVLFELHGQP